MITTCVADRGNEIKDLFKRNLVQIIAVKLIPAKNVKRADKFGNN